MWKNELVKYSDAGQAGMSILSVHSRAVRAIRIGYDFYNKVLN